MWTLRVAILINVFWISFTLTGCLETLATGTESGSTAVSAPNPNPSLDPARTICDPFKTNSQQARDRGLVGNLVYLTNDQPRYTHVQDYLDHAVIAPVTLYLDRLFTPPRPFDLGFRMQNGELVTSINGDTVYQYFGLQVKSQLQLASNEAPGYYQLALLADTGGRIRITDANGLVHEIVTSKHAGDDDDENRVEQLGGHEDDDKDEVDKNKNDPNDKNDLGNSNDNHQDENDHDDNSVKFACASEAIYMDRNSKLPVTVDYFQANGSHISLMAMWRPLPAANAKMKDKFCKRDIHSFFKFSKTAPATPKIKFYEMLAAGWKVLENENFLFPAQDNNPCVPTEPPLAITGFSISGVARDRVTLTWTTNIAATSQGKSTNVVTKLSALTASDPSLVENHSLVLTGLLPNTLYSIQAISTKGAQTATSDERVFRTPR